MAMDEWNGGMATPASSKVLIVAAVSRTGGTVKLAPAMAEIFGDFNCAGFNDNSFLKFFGGMNRGKPDARDIGQARAFAEELKQRFRYPLTSG